MLVRASDAEKHARDGLTASAWGRGLTVDQFLERERVLRSHAFARASMRTWLWREGEHVVSSCETFEVEATCDGVTGRAFIIASVFTEPRLRGRGHAVAMIDALCRTLEQEPRAMAVVLFSEVGASIYERAGFTLVQGHDVVVDANALIAGANDTTLQRSMPGDRVSASPLVSAPRPTESSSPECRLVLSRAQCEWQVERETFYASALGRKAPEVHSASLGGSSLAFCAAFQANELHVLWYRLVDDAHAAPLLRCAAVEALRCGFDTVRLWETARLPSLPGAARIARPDELPMIRGLNGVPSRWSGVERGLWA